MSYDFVSAFGSEVKIDSNSLVIGNGDQVPTNGHIKIHVKIHEY